MKKKEQPAALTSRTAIRVRFSEVDSMQVVWHGAYMRYFEDGREDFGRRYAGLGYADLAASGYLAPVVEASLRYHNPLRLDDTVVVETRYIDTEAAKIRFEYILRRESDGETVATGSTVQVFVDRDGNLSLLQPDFYAAWKRKWLGR